MARGRPLFPLQQRLWTGWLRVSLSVAAVGKRPACRTPRGIADSALRNRTGLQFALCYGTNGLVARPSPVSADVFHLATRRFDELQPVFHRGRRKVLNAGFSLSH